MRKILLLVILLLSFSQVNAGYVDYDYKGKKFNLFVPENISYLEYKYFAGEQLSSYYTRLIQINTLLVKKGLKPIY